MPNTVSGIEEAISKHFLNKWEQSEFEWIWVKGTVRDLLFLQTFEILCIQC